MLLPAAAEAVRSAEARCVGASLAARLFRPVQRMCVYPLLFKELLKKEGKAGCEESAIVDVHRASLHRAMSAMHAVVMQVNEEVRKLETLTLTLTLALTLTLTLTLIGPCPGHHLTQLRLLPVSDDLL